MTAIKISLVLGFLSLPACNKKVIPAVTADLERTQPATNEIFEGGFGEHFEYSPEIVVDYNPHGGATKARFLHDGIPVGFMLVTTSPEKKMLEVLLKDVIIESTKKQYGATKVEYSEFTNRSGFTFHHFSSDANHEGIAYRYELFLHIDNRDLPSEAQSFIADHFGMHKFEFLIPDNRFSTVMPLLSPIIDTFTPMEMRDEK